MNITYYGHSCFGIEVNGKNILFATKNLPPRNNRYSPEGHISGAVLSGEEVLSIETSINEGAELKRPSYWGGYLVVPHLMEFWQGRSNRLHDRIEYKLNPASKLWTFVRLAP